MGYYVTQIKVIHKDQLDPIIQLDHHPLIAYINRALTLSVPLDCSYSCYLTLPSTSCCKQIPSYGINYTKYKVFHS